MVLRSALASVAALVAASAALAGPPFARVRTLTTARGSGSVSVTVGLQPLRSRAWLVRLGGTGIARGKAEVTCTADSGAAGDSETFAFTIAPGGRQELWRSLGKGNDNCVVRVALRARGQLVVQVRGS